MTFTILIFLHFVINIIVNDAVFFLITYIYLDIHETINISMINYYWSIKFLKISSSLIKLWNKFR